MTSARLPGEPSRLRPRPRLRRLGAPVALAAAMVVGAAACDVTVNVGLTCSVVGPLFSQRVRSVASENVTRGGPVQLELSVGWIDGRGAGTVTDVELALPMPIDLASVDEVTFTPSGFTGSWTVAGRQVVLTFTGAVPEQTVALPKVTLRGTVAADARGGSFPWRAPSSTTWSVAYPDGTFSARCAPTDQNTVINNSYVS